MDTTNIDPAIELNLFFYSMYKLLLAGITVLLLAGCASTNSTVTDPEIIGLWQYQDKEIWIQIDGRGRVFQCRIGFVQETFTSTGALLEDNVIKWEKIWEPSSIRMDENSLLVDDLFGELRFEKTEFPIDDVCENPLN